MLSVQDPQLQRFMAQCAISFEVMQKLQKRVSTDEDLKFTDLFKYYQREADAAKSLLYRYFKVRDVRKLESADSKNAQFLGMVQVTRPWIAIIVNE